MKNRGILFITFFIYLLPLYSNAQDIQEPGTLNLNIKNIQQAKGAIFIAVYDNKEIYMKERFHEAIVEVQALGELHATLRLPFSKYAITIFHDVNDNEELDANFIGIPKEPYGFSNNPKSSFGPPGFDAAAFEFEKDGYEIEIVLK
jgi:uncharacterized protein (DUF2141 family)